MRLKVTALSQNYKISSRKQLHPVLLNSWQKNTVKHNNMTIVKTSGFCIIMLLVSMRT